MRQEDIWDADAADGYDTPCTGMSAPEVLGPTVDRLAVLAGSGRALEFAIGTGRVAIPLAKRSALRARIAFLTPEPMLLYWLVMGPSGTSVRNPLLAVTRM